MSQEPSQVVFPLHANTESCIFTYQSVSLKAPRKRGRPKGSPKNGKANHSQDKCGDVDPQNYNFVNYTGNVTPPGQALQKLIRRRGMLQFFRAKRQSQAIRGRSLEAPTTPLICQPNSVDPFDAAPLQMDPYAHDLLKHCCTSIWRRLYLIEQKAEFNPIAEFWMPLAFQDRALLHALIAFSGFYTSWNTSIEDQPLIFNHLKKAIAQANERMADRTKAVSTETLVVVALVAIIQSLHGIGENWGHTMGGLRMLIDTQGGLGSLEQKPMVLGAIYRADLSGSVDVVRRPFLAAKHFTWPGTRDWYPLRSGFIHLQEIMDMHRRLKNCIGSLDETIASLRQLYGKNMADAAKCRFVITECQYDLLSLECEDIPNELCRLSLIIYTVAVLDERPHEKPAYDNLLQRFRKVWDICNREHAVGLTPQFRLWALVAATSICRTLGIRSWCVSETSHALTSLNVKTLDALTACMEGFLPLCDVLCQEVWLQCQGSF